MDVKKVIIFFFRKYITGQEAKFSYNRELICKYFK